jgi:hypothetical protein
VTPEWDVLQVASWQGVPPGQEAGIVPATANGSVLLKGKTRSMGREMIVAAVSCYDGGVLFGRGDPADEQRLTPVTDKQIEAALADAGWVRLAPPGGGDAVNVVLKPMEASARLDRSPDDKHALTGRAALPRFMAHFFRGGELGAPPELTDEGDYSAGLELSMEGENELVVQLRYHYEVPPKLIRAEQQLARAREERDSVAGKVKQLDRAVQEADQAFKRAGAPIARAEDELAKAAKSLTDEKKKLDDMIAQAKEAIAEMRKGGSSQSAIDGFVAQQQAHLQQQREIVGERLEKVASCQLKLKRARSQHGERAHAAETALKEAEMAARSWREKLNGAKKALEEFQKLSDQTAAEEREKRKRVFGRFPEPVEIRLGEDLIARIHLEPPA